jgi:hypothetical protein
MAGRKRSTRQVTKRPTRTGFSCIETVSRAALWVQENGHTVARKQHRRDAAALRPIEAE